MKIIKATDQQKQDYWWKIETTYPLYGYVSIKTETGETITAHVEDLMQSNFKGPRYEIIVPTGYTMDNCHSLLCFDLKDLKERAGIIAEKCDCDDCKRYWSTKL